MNIIFGLEDEDEDEDEEYSIRALVDRSKRRKQLIDEAGEFSGSEDQD